ncbi:M60 family metallopeptidase [Aeoliella sp.]|uniref:M60 family metallopeptidase n=1 Tax=Aeoliella sp. TaxID=2795800 RepID=UPI003CCB8912
MLNAGPVAVGDRVLAVENEALSLATLLANDSDGDGDLLSIVSYSIPSHGSVDFVRGEGYFYTPDTGFVGSDNFNYTVSDGTDSAQASVEVDVNPGIDASVVRATLLSGVASLADPGSPGRMVAYGPTTVTVAEYPADPEGGPMIAAATWGQGRVVALPDHQWLRMGAFASTGDTGQFYINSIEWLAGTSDKNIKIVLADAGDSATENWLESQGYLNVVRVANYTSHLSDADLLIGWLAHGNSQTRLDAISDFVEGGGGLFIAEYGQGYQGYNNWWPDEVHEVDANRLLRDAGLGFSGGARSGSNLMVAAASVHYDAQFILSVLASAGNYTSTQQAGAMAQLPRLAEILPPEDTLWAQLVSVAEDAFEQINPTPGTPVASSFEKALLELEMQLIANLTPQSLTAHRTAEAVYGTIPDDAQPVVGLQVSVDTTKTGWLPTGLYAPPGDLVTIEVPSALVGKGYFLQIGGHVDNISSRASWDRVPFGVDRRYEITSTTIEVASAFGGAIYIDVGGQNAGTPPAETSTTIEVTGAIKAPFFVLGETSNEDWIATIRDFPAPYAELVSNGLTMSVPSDWIRALDDPEALMNYWDQVVAFQDWVGGFEQLRTGPERFNVDVQISVGLLHAGYPIQGPTWASEELVDLEYLLQHGNWGYFHELGHEMQRHPELGWGYENPYTFAGDTEVTVNIFANAALESQVVAPPYSGSGWAYSVYPGLVMDRARSTINDNSSPGFDDKDPYPFYFQLSDAFGWETYREVLKGYVDDQQNNPSALPSTNQEKKDQWLIRWSEATGYNLVRYMVDEWGLEVSQGAVDQVSAMGLPTWLPVTTTVQHFRLAGNESRNLSLATTGISLDGVAAFVSVAQPENGTLVDNGDGTYTYTPDSGFVGVDEIAVTYQSSVRNRMTTILKAEVAYAPPQLTGDYDYSGMVDEGDYAVWKQQFGNAGDVLSADGNGDGRVNLADYAVWRNNLGASLSNSVTLGDDIAYSSALGTTASSPAEMSAALPSTIQPSPYELAFASMTIDRVGSSGTSKSQPTHSQFTSIHEDSSLLLLLAMDRSSSESLMEREVVFGLDEIEQAADVAGYELSIHSGDLF